MKTLTCLSTMGIVWATAMGCSSSTNTSNPPGSTPEGGSGTGGSSSSGGSSSNGASSGSGGSTTAGGTSQGQSGAAGAATAGSGGASSASGGRASGGGAGRQGGAGGSAVADAGGSPPDTDASTGAGSPSCTEILGLAEAYKAAHPGNGGKDWDINAKTPAEIAADPAAQRLLSICGKDERPVIPLLAWEYGGGDHSWINPDASAVAYCVYIPVHPDSAHWQYDASADHVTADVYVPCPDQNPCKSETGANQVMSCLGDSTNIEILVDTASLNDGVDAGLALANASTDLNLITSAGSTVHMYTGT